MHRDSASSAVWVRLSDERMGSAMWNNGNPKDGVMSVAKSGQHLTRADVNVDITVGDIKNVRVRGIEGGGWDTDRRAGQCRIWIHSTKGLMRVIAQRLRLWRRQDSMVDKEGKGLSLALGLFHVGGGKVGKAIENVGNARRVSVEGAG